MGNKEIADGESPEEECVMIVSELMRLLKALPKSAPVMVMADGKGGFCVPAITIKTMASAPAEVMPGGYVQVDRSK